MPKFADDNVHKLCRRINGKMWKGWHWSDSREENKALAKYLRRLGVPVRAITLPETSNTNYGMNAPERYVIYAPVDLPAKHNIYLQIEHFYKMRQNP